MSTTAIAAEAGELAPTATSWVVFSCAGSRYGIQLDHVSEILTPRPFTRLPGAGPQVCGLAGVRGRVITVFDLGILLGPRAAASLPDHRLLLLDYGARCMGAAVDDIVDIAPARVARAAESAAGVMGIGHTEDGTFTALDPQQLLAQLLPA